MKPFHVVGQPGSGKTTLIVDIIQELIRQDIRVGTIKHSTHVHELDKPGKDSFRHRKAGASPVSMMTRDLMAVYMPRTREMTPRTLLEKYYSDLDMVLIEGWISGPYPKIEVWRNAGERPPLFLDISQVKALITDDQLDDPTRIEAGDQRIQCFARNDVGKLVKWIKKML